MAHGTFLHCVLFHYSLPCMMSNAYQSYVTYGILFNNMYAHARKFSNPSHRTQPYKAVDHRALQTPQSAERIIPDDCAVTLDARFAEEGTSEKGLSEYYEKRKVFRRDSRVYCNFTFISVLSVEGATLFQIYSIFQRERNPSLVNSNRINYVLSYDFII